MAPISKNQKDFVKTIVLNMLEENTLSDKVSDEVIESVFKIYSDVVNNQDITPSEKHAILIATMIGMLLK